MLPASVVMGHNKWPSIKWSGKNGDPSLILVGFRKVPIELVSVEVVKSPSISVSGSNNKPPWHWCLEVTYLSRLLVPRHFLLWCHDQDYTGTIRQEINLPITATKRLNNLQE